MKHLVCVGLGYTARRLARLVAAEGFDVTGTSRRPEGVAALRADGWTGIPFDGEQRSEPLSDALSRASHLLVSAAPDAGGDPLLRLHGACIAAAAGLRWVGVLSTIGVYGDHGGAWVDEATPPRPGNERSRLRLAAEEAWRDHARRTGQRVIVFRLPGIYGPGRSAIDSLKAGTARRIVKPGQIFNRMHVDDIASALHATMVSDTPHDIYNLTDDEPSPPGDVVLFAANLLGMSPPPEVPIEHAGLSPMGLSFYGEAKRVSNRRMTADLRFVLRYPTYREGLAALHSDTG